MMNRRNALTCITGLSVAALPRKRPTPKPKRAVDEWRECQACHGLGLQCEPLYLLNTLAGVDPRDIAHARAHSVIEHNGCFVMSEVLCVVQVPTRPPKQCPACEGSGGRYHRRLAEEEPK